MSEPKTAKQFNSPLVGDASFTVTAKPITQTIASGYAYGLVMTREIRIRQAIYDSISKFIQDDIIIQQATAAVFEAIKKDL